MDLRPYQLQLTADVRQKWHEGARNVLMLLPTGGGKTVVLAKMIAGHKGASAVIAHRQELVSQLSLTLAKHGVRHNIIAAQATRRAIAALHIAKLGACYFDPSSRCAVASVDTLIKAKGLESWFAQVTLWIVDEAHHVVTANKWDTCISRFTHPQCLGLGPTATPSRADGKGLGSHADGVFDAMVEGPPMRWLIDQKYLTDYRIIVPESDMVVLGEVGSTGDWSPKQLRDAAKRSHIVGDVVAQYLIWGAGKLGVTFAGDTETAAEMAQAYRNAGVRAETLTGKTEDGWRRQILADFEARRIDQIVAVDIISEGFDLPAIEVASFARRTESLSVYMQQFGRALRTLDGKERAIIIDHAGNVLRHGLPDKPRVWTLDRRDRKSRGPSDAIPTRVCGAGHSREALAQFAQRGREPCFFDFEQFHTECPHCGFPLPEPEPGGRSKPEVVAGDLYELDAETLARLRGEVDHASMGLDDYKRWITARGADAKIYGVNVARHQEKLDAQATLRAAMAEWGGRQLAAGKNDRQMQRLFYLQFGCDVLSAQALGRAEALALTEKVRGTWPNQSLPTP